MLPFGLTAMGTTWFAPASTKATPPTVDAGRKPSGSVPMEPDDQALIATGMLNMVADTTQTFPRLSARITP